MSRFSNDLLSNESATGAAYNWPGGRGMFVADGTFAGATVKLEYKTPAGNWVEAGSETTLTSAGGGIFEMGSVPIRAAISGGSPSGVYARVTTID